MMIDAISAAQIAMLQDQSRLQTINQNISNMQTPGYRRQIQEPLSFSKQLAPDSSVISKQMLNSTIMVQGTIAQSQNTNDLAIAGDGFFTVQNEKGIFYTRRGDLQINERGQLCTATGDLILGKSGIISVEDSQFTIDAQGIVYIDKQKIDQLNVVRFSNIQALQYRGQGLYESLDTPYPVDNSTRVLQGFIEQSNVKSVDEMLDLVKISRHFEASQRIMHIADSLLSTAINQLGEGNV